MTDLASWVRGQRWFRSKSRAITRSEVLERIPIAGAELVAFRVEFESGPPETYALAMRDGADALGEVARPLIDLVAASGSLGSLRAERGPSFEDAFGGGIPEPRVLSAEQSNSAVLFGDRAILKVYRTLVAGENPEVEILRALATRAVSVPRLVGTIDWGESAFAMVQAFVPNRGDGWSVTLSSADEGEDVARARELGSRTAELHLALADAFGIESQAPAVEAVRVHASAVVSALDDPRLNALRESLDARLGRAHVEAPAIRVHGDYHLGQVLIGLDGAPVILDFEGEPARTLEERRAKASPFKDVAGMMRSYAYSSATSKRGGGWTDRVAGAFLDAWRRGIEGSALATEHEAELLDFYLLEKALYEIEYERNNRPAWLPIPLEGVIALLDRGAR